LINKEITILIVAYKSDTILLRNLSYLKNFNVIIIDNFKDSNLKEKITSFKNINYAKTNFNLGEGSGAKIGLGLINSKYTLYLNPDTIINEINILKLKEIFFIVESLNLFSNKLFNNFISISFLSFLNFPLIKR